MADFYAVSNAIKAGEKARRATWSDGDYCFLDDVGRSKEAFYFNATRNKVSPHIFYWDDLDATDWEVLE